MRGPFAAWVLLLVCTGSSVWAEDHKDGPSVGDNGWAMPGLHRVDLPTPGPRRFALSFEGGYGFTEELANEGPHHRLIGNFGASLRALPWLSFGLRLDGRYDKHPDVVHPDGTGDDGFVGDPRLGIRAGGEVASGLSLGAQVALWLPGSDAPSVEFGALSVETSLLLGYRTGGLTLGTELGFRFDNSAKSIDDPQNLRGGDRIALGVSDYHALMVGLGASYRTGSLELLGEFSWDILLGSAPDITSGEDTVSATESPLRVALGARIHPSEAVQISFLAEISPGSRPDIDERLIPIEPRFSVLAGFGYALPLDKPAEVTEGTDHTETPKTSARTIRGRVLDGQGQPVVDAAIHLEVAGHPARDIKSDSAGMYVFDQVPPSAATVTVTKDGYETLTFELGADESPPKELALEASSPRGELRGLVRSFGGDPLLATIRVGDQETTTDEEGRFTLELDAGSYEVTIESDGYQSQTRSVQIEENGVTVLNVDLRSQ